MKTKSLLFLALALALSLCLALVACGDKGNAAIELGSDSGVSVVGVFDNGSALSATLHAADSEQGKTAVSAIDKPYDSAKVAVFDIAVTKGGEKVQPSGKVKVTLPKPFESELGYVTYHIKDDNTVEELATSVGGNNLTFETTSFSYFVVAGLVNADQQHIHSYVEKVTDRNLVALGELSQSFGKILGWNLLWAFLSTFINYFLGLGLAILYNKKCVKPKALWRAFPVLAYAVPGFISLLVFHYMFSNGGPINQLIVQNGGKIIDFLGINSKWMARGIGLFVNAWLSVPSIMLLASGILSNINNDLYEAARIDGASAWMQFRKITLPFVLFSTTPVLISQFMGNFNNFGVFYFLRSDVLSDGYFLASDTDLLINWLYRMSIDNNYYSIGAAISLIMFIITSAISLLVYMRSSAYKREDTFK